MPTSLIPVMQMLCVIATPAQATQPVDQTAEGHWAFDQLAAVYAQPAKSEELLKSSLFGITSTDHNLRRIASQRLSSLFKQSLADEINGRSEWRQLPFFGGGAESSAREFRKTAAQELSEATLGEEVIDLALWLILHDPQAENQSAGIQALRKIQSPKINDAFHRILSAPVHHQAVLIGVIEETGIRMMKNLADPIASFCKDYRAPVREAAIKEARNLGFVVPAEFHPDRAFTPWLEQELHEMAAMVLTDIPANAPWRHFTVTEKPSRPGDPPSTDELSGWLLEETSDDYQVLNFFAEKIRITKATTKVSPRTLKEEASEFLKIRAAASTGDDNHADSVMKRLSRRGGLTGQFEPSFISVPEAMMAVWAFQRGDRTTAADLIFPRYGDAPNERWIKEGTRDMLGGYYQDQLLSAYSYERDYPAALILAKHLSTKPFDGYRYQPRARELVEQLSRRQTEDFKTLALPTNEHWKVISKGLSRPEQVEYLARRLRLLNCFQRSQPGGVSYEDEQTKQPARELENDASVRPVPVINPYTELRLMKLEVRDLSALSPFLADENFMLTYSYWRDFHPARTLHRVNWAVGQIVNSVAKRRLSDLKAYEHLDKSGKQKQLIQISQWIAENSAKTSTQLLIETISSSQDFSEFSSAAIELIHDKVTSAQSVFVRRLNDFPNEKAELVEMCYRLNPDGVLEQARQWAKQDNLNVQLWAGLILLHSGDQSKQEGLETLRHVLQKDEDGEQFYPAAFDALLATKQEPAIKLACEVLKMQSPFPGDFGFNGGAMVHRLLLAGRQEALDYLANELTKRTSSGSFSGEYQGVQVERQLTEGDRAATTISEWRNDGYAFDMSAPDDQRLKERETLKRWLTEQIALIRQGKTSSIRSDVQPIGVAHWQVDTP